MTIVETNEAKIEEARLCWEARRERRSNPDGKFDKAGRWHPSDTEKQACCGYIRYPSRAYPYSYMTHCRSIQHVATLHNVDVKDLRKAINQLTRGA